MKRRNFLASLMALPFVAKRFRIEEEVNCLPERLRRMPIGPPVKIRTKADIEALAEAYCRMRENDLALRENTRALLLYTPTGFKKGGPMT